MKTIKGYYGKYKITKEGRVWSTVNQMFLKTQIGKFGYPIIRLGRGRTNKSTHYIHRLLAIAYIPTRIGFNKVNHKNGIKTDNRLSNLEWCTQKQNVRHAWKIGLAKPRYNEAHHRTKLSLEKIAEIKPKMDGKYGTLTKLAKEYAVSISLLSLIQRGYRTRA